jgi:hypothetical protein
LLEASLLLPAIAAVGSLAGAIVSGLFALRATRVSDEVRRRGESIARLTTATGALRLELFLETRSFARRLVHYWHESQSEDPLTLAASRMGATEGAYHAGGLMIYRLLRPLTVGEIIEQQTFDADLLVDRTMVDLLRFSHAGMEMLTGDQLGRGFDGDSGPDGFDMSRCWDPDRDLAGLDVPSSVEGPAATVRSLDQRIRGSYLRTAAAALVLPSAAGAVDRETKRCMTHPEFRERWEHPAEHDDFHDALTPVKSVIGGFSPSANPIFWLRLVAYAHVCNWFYDRVREEYEAEHPHGEGLRRHDEPIEYTPVKLDVPGMLNAAEDRYLTTHASDYADRFDEIIGRAL